jgi:hypothetical protein
LSAKLKFGQVLARALIASVIATVIGSEIIGLYVAVTLAGESSNGLALILIMIVGAPFLAAMWVIPSGTLVAVLLSPFALRVAPIRDQRGLFLLVVAGSVAGFLLLFLAALAITFAYSTHSPLSDALGLSQIYGPVFGGLTAAGWWWQLPKTDQPSQDQGTEQAP